jgi:hypothetical protein
MYAGVSCSTIEKTGQKNKTGKEKHPDNHLAPPGKQRIIISCNTLVNGYQNIW